MTGVQTCALPIWPDEVIGPIEGGSQEIVHSRIDDEEVALAGLFEEIGRASCRERV